MYVCVNTLTCSQVDVYDAPEQIKASLERITDELAFIMVCCQDRSLTQPEIKTQSANYSDTGAFQVEGPMGQGFTG